MADSSFPNCATLLLSKQLESENIAFDVGSAAAASSLSTPQFVSAATIDGGEPALLEELGINTRQIYQKTLSILNPFIVKADLHEDADLSGPFVFLMVFGLFQLLAGKIHFGIILGWVTMASLFLYAMFKVAGIQTLMKRK